MTSGLVGSTAMHRTRPPTLRGPRGIQLWRAPAASAPVTSAARRGLRSPAAWGAAWPGPRTGPARLARASSRTDVSASK